MRVIVMNRVIISFLFSFCFLGFNVVSFPYIYADIRNQDNRITNNFQSNLINIRNTNGKLYAYIVLLFNENPHFVNLIQEDSISLEMMQKDDFHTIEYKNYCKSIKNSRLKRLAEKMLSVNSNPEKYTKRHLISIERTLSRRNIVLRFSKDRTYGSEKIILDYCIYGRRKPIKIVHPLFHVKEKIYNIQPLIYYDEFSTSNSTFYFDMIYINPEEVENDYVIAKSVLVNRNVDSMFFVGARITDDIKYCLKRAFNRSRTIKQEIWKMFEIHEITHKILNNRYNFFDQVTGEELALVSTIYSNPYLGLSVLYSYLDYSAVNPHRIAAMNYIRFIANRKNRFELIDNPSLIKHMNISEIVKLSKEHFYALIKSIK